MAVPINVDFYQTEMPADADYSLSDVISFIVEEVEDDDSRTTEFYGVPVRLQHAKSNSTYGWEGEFVRIRLNNLPSRTKTSGTQKPLHLDDDEGLGENTAFLFHPGKRIILVQSNLGSLKATQIQHYLSFFKNEAGPVIFHPVIKNDAMKKLARMKESKKLVVKLASKSKIQKFQTKSDGVESILNIGQYLDSPTLEIVASAPTKDGFLNVAHVKKTVTELLRMDASNTNEVVRLKVAGERAGDLMDILDYKLRITETINDSGRYITSDQRRDALRSAFNTAVTSGEI